MKKNTLLLAGLAGFAGLGAARAADLPAAPEPVDYVRVCDAYGAGYFYIPGTETCLRIQGGMRVELRFQDFADDGNRAWGSRNGNATTTRARAYVKFDSRTQTEYGLLRTFVDLWFTSDSGDNGNPAVELRDGFIQFGGFTFGRAESFFDFYTGDNWGSIIQQGFSDHRTNLFAYTYGFGNGFSATVSAEDATFVRNQTVRALDASSENDLYGGHKWPDLVANLRVDQGWGSAQVMGALHQVYGNSRIGDSEIGFAVGAGVTFNAPMLAPGDTVSFQGAYSKGALRYVHEDAVFPDFVRSGDELKSAKAWGFGGGVTHYWMPTLSSALTATYTRYDMSGVGDDLDIDQWGVQGNLVWSPVAGFLMGAELEYEGADWSLDSGRATNLDDDTFVGVFRVQRTF
ncbi:porin-like protein [Breoghania corrubedonensis]|uniref:Porin n=1 Tax=Breoghania corrubedonensis TaxID=665038 RepID=A0A2T5VC57_9HYPH|nr:porin [Breoghania corrubedonensis]PTW61333.1 porin-like protein [Breoghania corrubedonensis]